MFQLSTVEKAKKSRQTATKILPKVVPNATPKAVCARLVLAMVSPAALTSLPVNPLARIPPGVYRVEMITSAFRVRTTKVSMKTPMMATTPCSWGVFTFACACA